jgi:hypothetical protein
VKFEGSGVFIVDGKAGDISRQEITRTLNPAEAQAEGLCDCNGKGRFSKPGQVLDEQMPPREKSDERKLKCFCLTVKVLRKEIYNFFDGLALLHHFFSVRQIFNILLII